MASCRATVVGSYRCAAEASYQANSTGFPRLIPAIGPRFALAAGHSDREPPLPYACCRCDRAYSPTFATGVDAATYVPIASRIRKSLKTHHFCCCLRTGTCCVRWKMFSTFSAEIACKSLSTRHLKYFSTYVQMFSRSLS